MPRPRTDGSFVAFMREKTHWHPEVLANAVQSLLKELTEKRLLEAFYLAGGTGIALHFGHRLSQDLDFFCQDSFHEDALLGRLRSLGTVSVSARDRQTLHLVIRAVRVSLMAYPYPLLFPADPFQDVPVADPRDIACMKISAISSRGTKRDFIDLYVAAQTYPLPHLLDLFKQKYASFDFNTIHILKSLVYFEEADREPMPRCLSEISWDDVKRFFREESVRLLYSESGSHPTTPRWDQDR